ncbi:MAG: polynucleotide adenylyltransferase/metal dependent phosphohydrolase [Parcubacteria group bacterium Greene0714_21]|nr:MAG: polynucleotide adenylyltransferase/metal dependent phosphohydrolase [Parcubacteria group bacterium Greene0416_39]TSC98372.1 MAG: polynucleotide adenylyltransferase/metal dependent phosphohydrolase [Parcubacteria group bacterium Greene1014_47]TSD04023.1 MAG: polynucleotide adenylyltransferase/metal dependent phosphohydrolase [Parcubacteria group bacterium Greene0714_21]
MDIPKEVQSVVAQLEKKGFEAYIVGGCVRDLLLQREPEDWDVATSAKPEEVQAIFPDNFYENKFFTVTVQTQSANPKLKDIEVTTFRSDMKYGDRRHPEEVQYAKTIEEDLARRDFTINAMALGLKLVDPFEGQKDLKVKLIRAVGDADARFQEDALRMMRGVRFAATLGFELEEKTSKAIEKNSALLKEISQERIRDELVKIIMGGGAAAGVEQMRELRLLQYIIPELLEGVDVSQNKHHIYNVWEHNLHSLEYATSKGWGLRVRLAVLLHDVGKPRTKRGEGLDATFYNHEVEGAKMMQRILSRLKFSREDTEQISDLVRYHMFYYNVGEVTESSVRRLLAKIGPENMEELLQVRMADRIGSGVPKAQPYKLRHLRYIIDKVSQDPISAKMLKLNGDNVMKLLKISPGPKVGWVLDVLLGEVLDDPAKNKKELLEARAKELHALLDKDLKELSLQAKHGKEEVETERDKATKQKYWVT